MTEAEIRSQDIGRWQRRQLWGELRQERVNNFLEDFDLLGVSPDCLQRNQRQNLELAFLNARLQRRGFEPLDPQRWSALSCLVGKLPRKNQFQVLESHGLLRKEI